MTDIKTLQDNKTELYRPSLATRLIFTFGVLGIFIVWIFILFLFANPERVLIYLGLFAVYLAPGAGKESIIPILVAAGCPLAIIISGIVIIDMVLGVVISYNFDLLLKVPLLGRALRFFTTKTATLLKNHPWIAGLASAGLFLFMYIPFMGSSAINTSIVGRILAIHPKILMPVIFMGSLCATLTVAVGARAIIDLWLMNPFYAILAVVALVFLGYIIYRIWTRFVKKRF